MTTIRAIITLALLALALPVAAQPYIAAGLANVNDGDQNSGATFAAGWQFGSFGAEVSYFDAGDLTGTGIAATGTLPLSGPWSLVGKLGVYKVELETVTSTGVAPGTGTATSTTTSYSSLPAVGFGVAYRVSEKFSLRALAEHIDGKDDLDRVRLFSISAAINF